MRKTITISCLLAFMASFAVAQDSETKGNKAQGGTGFKINFFRTFEFDESTVIKEDGNILPGLDAQGGTGYKVRYQLTGDVNANLTTGVFAEVDLINVLKGPITSLAPLKVFNTEVQTTAETYYPDQRVLADFALNQTVKLSGYVFNDSDVLASRVQETDASENWKLSGYAEQVSSNQFEINGQLIDYEAKDLLFCDSPLSAGDFVEVEAIPMVNFTAGQTLSTVISVSCVDRSVLADGGENLAVAVEGMIDQVLMDGDFVLAGQAVVVDQQTKYIRGKAEDIQEQIKVEVEGQVNDITGEIMADKVRFVDARFSLVAPVMPNDVIGGEYINVAGVSISLTPQTQDPDNLLLTGINQPTQVKLKGYVDTDLNLYATKIEDKGSADFNDVSLNAEVSDVNQPLLALAGVTVDTTGSLFFDEQGQAITAAAFFAMIGTGSEVEVEQATLDQNTQQLALGSIRIESLNDTETISDKHRGDVVIAAKGVGTVTSLPDPIFGNSFE